MSIFFEEILYLNNKKYDLVRVQRGDFSAVYKGLDTYLRIGDPNKINKDLIRHREMEKFGFPVSQILEEGEFNNMSYFIEASIGEKKFGTLFREDYELNKEINENNFNNFLEIINNFAKAQLNTQVDVKDFDNFTNGVYLNVLCGELPQYKEKILSIFLRVKERLSVFPFVLTHGDFNANNIYPKGIIDFEDSFYGPFGYDLVCAFVHIDYFPTSHEYEYFARYRFNEQQKKKYFDLIDSIALKAGMQPFSNFEKDFEFCRACWLLVRMHKTPKLQQFRYDLFIERFLK